MKATNPLYPEHHENMEHFLILNMSAIWKMCGLASFPSIPIVLSAGGVINGETGLSLVIVLSLLAGAFYVGSELKEIKMSIAQIKDDLASRPCHMIQSECPMPPKKGKHD